MANVSTIVQDCRYLDAKQSVICIGAPGLGKTHIATALAVAACEQSRRVRFYNVAALVTLLTQAQDEGKLTAFLQRSLNEELIVLDELGFIPFSQSGARLMFQFCSALYEQVSLIVTTNLPFAQWTQVFGDEQLTVALLDRLTYRAHILEFVGNSHRLRERLSQKKESAVDVASSPLAPKRIIIAPSLSRDAFASALDKGSDDDDKGGDEGVISSLSGRVLLGRNRV